MMLQKCPTLLLWLVFFFFFSFSLCSLFAMETFEKKKMKTHYGSVLPEQLLQVVTLLRLPVGVPTHDNHSWYVILLSGIK